MEEEEQEAKPGAELTYISLSERNVNYAPDHHHSIEHVPRVFEITLRQAAGVSDDYQTFISGSLHF